MLRHFQHILKLILCLSANHFKHGRSSAMRCNEDSGHFTKTAYCLRISVMYTYNKCKCEDCKSQALSVFDQNMEITEESGWCLEHHPDREKVISQIYEYIQNHDKIIGLTACGIEFNGLDWNGKKFYGCNMQKCTFTNIHAENIRSRMSIFDRSTFTDCEFINSNIQFSSFAASKFVHVVFTGSALVHLNFNGITSYQTSFDDSDLYNSRFIKATLINSSLRNCNLKKTVLYESVRENVSFKLSNTRESLADRRRGGMMGDIDTDFSNNNAVQENL